MLLLAAVIFNFLIKCVGLSVCLLSVSRGTHSSEYMVDFRGQLVGIESVLPSCGHSFGGKYLCSLRHLPGICADSYLECVTK